MKNTFILLLAFLVGCTSAETRFEQELSTGQCESALEKMPENEVGAKLVSKTYEAGGKTLSYALTGLSYTSEVLLDVVGGTVMVVVLCGPSIAAGVLTTNQNQDVSLVCFPGKIDALSAPAIGRKTYDGTSNWRCPNLAPMSRSVRRVAECFSNRNTKDSLERASKSLTALQTSQKFYECLPAAEQTAVNEQLELVKTKLKSF